MMLFNSKKQENQNMDQILVLDNMPYKIPHPKAPCAYNPTTTQDYHRVVVGGNIKSIKKEDPVTK